LIPSRALPKFESYGMPETAAFRGWKAQDAIEWFHGIDRLVAGCTRAQHNSHLHRRLDGAEAYGALGRLHF
jgi:hypothetical protein